MKTAIVTDTNSGLSARQAEELGIYLIPMPFFVGEETYYEGKDITHADFFEKLRAGEDVFTSQPSPSVIISMWEKLLQDYDRVLHFPMTAELSGSYETAKALALDYDGRVLVVDDRRISVSLEQSLRNALVLLEQGKTAEQVKEILEEERFDASIYIALDTVEYLKKGGRLSATGAAMATILSIKPVLQVKEGRLEVYKKVRGMKNAKGVLIGALKNDLETRFRGVAMNIFAGYSGGDPALGEGWLQEVQAAFPDALVRLISLPLSICCHTGEGALGVGCAKAW